jgi:hypothetical protein
VFAGGLKLSPESAIDESGFLGTVRIDIQFQFCKIPFFLASWTWKYSLV